MRILFLHAGHNGVPAEYRVHTTLAMSAPSGNLESFFIWQSPLDLANFESLSNHSTHFILNDFGRNMSITPKVKHIRRAGMIFSRLPKTLAFLLTKTKHIQPDIIYTSQQYFDVILAEFLSKTLHIPHVIHLHYNVGPWLGKYTFHVIRRSRRLIAVSEYVRQTGLLQGVTASNIHTIVNPRPISSVEQNTTPENVRKEFNFDEKTPVVVAVGRLDPGKGHLALIEAFAKVIHRIPDARLIICGGSTWGSNYSDLLQKRVKELQLSSYVIFAGQRSDIPAILSASNVFCLPTELDPCPLVFLEAMEAGLPIVAYYSGGVPEMVLQNHTGLLSYPNDVTTLAENLIQVLADTNLAYHLGEAGRQRVLTEFNPKRVAERWLKVVNEMV